MNRNRSLWTKSSYRKSSSFLETFLSVLYIYVIMEPQLRKHLVETVKKKLGLPENKITMKPELRERLKNALRPLVVEALKQNKALLNEITYTTFKSTPQKQLAPTLTEKFSKALKATFDGATVEENTNNGKILFQDGKGGCCFDVEVVPMSKDNYRVEAIAHGSGRIVALNLTEDQVVDFIKKDLKEFVEAGSATEQAYAKNAIPENKEVTKEKADQDEPDDKMKEVKGEKKQADHKPLEPKERKEGANVVGTPGMKTMKVKKQEDAPSKEKVTLKADKENASKEKVVQKLDDTPALKDAKK
jgi:hypothetical protein